jgi:hypothetical protein
MTAGAIDVYSVNLLWQARRRRLAPLAFHSHEASLPPAAAGLFRRHDPYWVVELPPAVVAGIRRIKTNRSWGHGSTTIGAKKGNQYCDVIREFEGCRCLVNYDDKASIKQNNGILNKR